MPAIVVLTPVEGADGGSGTYRERFYDVSFISDGVNANYITTGLPILPDDVGLLQIFEVNQGGHATLTGVAQTTYPVPSYDFKTNKLQLWGTAAGATGLTEIANTQAISSFVYRLRFVGI